MSRTPMRIILIVCSLAIGACSTAYYTESADDDAEEILAAKGAAFERFRQDELLRPDKGEEVTVPEDQSVADYSDVPEEVGLRESLAVATRYNRDYLSERESLYLSALNLTGVRNRFSFFFTGTLSALLLDTRDTKRFTSSTARFGVSKILPTGGVVTFNATGNAASGFGDETGYDLDANWTASLSQPLLRDAGYETSHEALTQAERNVVYAVRDFELFREDFTIDITARFYALIRQIREIRNAEQDLKSKTFLKNQSESKYAVGLASQVDKLRSDREYLRAENSLLRLNEEHALDLDRFKIRLGLPTSFPLTIRYEEPEYAELDIRLDIAVEAALANRVDLLTAKDRVEDAERQVRISANQLLPDLDLEAGYSAGSAARPVPSLVFRDRSYTLGLALELPFERVSERNEYRRSVIERNRTVRNHSLAEDSVVLEVRGAVRRLRRAVDSLDFTMQEIDAAKRQARAAEIKFEDGEAGNRDVTEAQNAVLAAQNNYIRDLVEYQVARITLLRSVGILFIDEDGMWVEP